MVIMFLPTKFISCSIWFWLTQDKLCASISWFLTFNKPEYKTKKYTRATRIVKKSPINSLRGENLIFLLFFFQIILLAKSNHKGINGKPKFLYKEELFLKPTFWLHLDIQPTLHFEHLI